MPCFFCGSLETNCIVQVLLDGKKKRYSLCPLCAAEKGILQDGESFRIDLDELKNAFPEKERQEAVPVCPVCGSSRDAVVSMGMAGCSECYVSFREDLLLLFQDNHSGRTEELSDILQRQNYERRIRELEKDLSYSVSREDYERAADLRNRIGDLKKRMSGSHEF